MPRGKKGTGEQQQQFEDGEDNAVAARQQDGDVPVQLNEGESSTPPWARKLILDVTSVQNFIKDHLPFIQATTTRTELELASLATRINNAHKNAKKPRTILVKFLLYEDKERILRVSRQRKELFFKSSKFLIFPEYSVDMSRKRMEFNAIKAALHRLIVPFKLLVPARLVVHTGAKTHSYDNPVKARADLPRLLPDIRF
ncbi:hypothetical protein ABVT39_022655 [Epinephelus coioides]